MKWIFEHFQIVVVIVVALASLVKRRQDLAQAAEAERQAREDQADDAEVVGHGRERQPPLPSVPPPVAGQLPQQFVKKAASALARGGRVPQPVLSDVALILKQQQDIQERLRQIRETKATTTGGAAATRNRVSATQRHTQVAHSAKTGLRASLHSRQDIRRAIVLREILGPPLGLR